MKDESPDFILHPSSFILYRTGDLARYRADGTIEYLRRYDQQVKLRGYRIELGEIEAALRTHATVQESVVVVREDHPGEQRLVAYVVPATDKETRRQGDKESGRHGDKETRRQGDKESGRHGDKVTRRQGDKVTGDASDPQSLALSPQDSAPPSSFILHPSSLGVELRGFLKERLPEYMVPSAFVLLEALPLTPNGKVDRRALPAPDRDRATAAAYVAPRTPVEALLAQTWAELLRVERIGIHDNFFALGGHSLLATQLLTRIRKVFRVELPLRRLFEAPTVAELATQIGHLPDDGTAPLIPATRDTPPPLSSAQRRLWLLNQIDPDSPAYHLPIAIRLRGDVRPVAIQQSLRAIVRRHEVLRTTYAIRDGRMAQVIAAEAAPALRIIDLRALAGPTCDDELRRLTEEEARRPFDLARGPLLRGVLLLIDEAEHVLLLTLHHIAADGWSLQICFRELAAHYTALVGAPSATLPELPVQYADFAIWQQRWLQGPHVEAQLAYWREHLAGAPPALDLPTDRPRPALQTYNGARHALALPSGLMAAARSLSEQARVTLFMILLAAFQVLLMRYTGRRDIVVGAPIAGRTRAEVEHLIGCFINMLVLRVDLSGDPSFLALLERTHEVCLGAYEHQDLPFEQLVEALQPVRDLSRSPLFQVMFALQPATADELRLPDLTLEQLQIGRGSAKFDLSLELFEAPDGLRGWFEYNTDLFDAPTIARMASHFQTLLTDLLAHPSRPISVAQLLTAAERAQLSSWNATHVDYPAVAALHLLIEAQAARTPDAVAVVFDRPPSADTERGRGGEGEIGRQGDKETRRHGGWTGLSPQSSVLSPECLTYAELNRRANRLAHRLLSLGVGPDVPVAVCVERSVELVVGLLGVLKAGGAYVPLDPSYPPERLAFMLADARVPVLLTSKELGTRDLGLGTRDQEHDPKPLAPSPKPQAPGTRGWGAGDKVTGGQATPSHAPSPTPIVVCLDDERDAGAGMPDTPPRVAVTPDHLAYIIYTSGSTGQPKGAMNTHGGIVNRLRWMQATYCLDASDRVLQKTPFSFDVSVWEFFWPLIAGACLVVALPEGHKDSAYIARLIAEQQITTVHFVPSMLQFFVAEPEATACVSLRRVICSGEALPADLQERFFARLPHAGLHNLYGPTEAAVDVTFWACERDSQCQRVPIGRPIANIQIHILDDALQPVPVGVPGELYIGGAGLARGYWRRPDLTAERFLPNPFADDLGTRDLGRGAREKESDPKPLAPGTRDLGQGTWDKEPHPKPLAPSLQPHGHRLYRTGDLACYQPDGAIVYLGRIDHQIKLRGFRIELDEIEAHLVQHPRVREVVVVARADQRGEARLVAYVVPATDKVTSRQGDKETGDAGDSQSSVLSPQHSASASSFILHPSSLGAELRGFLKERLPEYMVPAAFVALDALPLTPSGKVDRRALPDPAREPAPGAPHRAPQTELEYTIAAIWQEVLQIERVGLEDNFFDLGGHSLLMIRVRQRLDEALGREVSMLQLFKYPTISALARHLGQPRDEQISAESAGARARELEDGQRRLQQLRRRRAVEVQDE